MQQGLHCGDRVLTPVSGSPHGVNGLLVMYCKMRGIARYPMNENCLSENAGAGVHVVDQNARNSSYASSVPVCPDSWRLGGGPRAGCDKVGIRLLASASTFPSPHSPTKLVCIGQSCGDPGQARVEVHYALIHPMAVSSQAKPNEIRHYG